MFFVHVLSLQKSTQKHNIPSFFLTKTTALHHGDWLGHIAPVSNISWSEVCTSSSSSGGIHLNHSLNGSLSVIRISCLTALIQPSSLPSSVKISWKASTWSHAAVAFWGVQLLRPSRLNFSRSFFCHSTTDRVSHLSSIPRMASNSGDNSTGRTGDVETTLSTCTPFFRKIEDPEMFLITMDTLLLLILSLLYACRMCNQGGRGHIPPG